jgi:GTP-binding protein Era
MSTQLPADHRSGFIALVGKPNVGKSTLLNAWLGARIAAVSAKPQTTRVRLLGILTRPDAQAIFVDTPGIHLPRTRLGEYMVKAAQEAILDADVILFIVDVSKPPTQADVAVARLLGKRGDVPVILAMNKADLLSAAALEEQRKAYEALGPFTEAESISALTGENRDRVLELALSHLPVGPSYYPEDQLTDQQERFIASELIREQTLELLQQEVPHAVAVVVEEFKERPNNVLYIAATIYTEKGSQKGIVIGRDGAMLKQIGSKARAALEPFFERRVYLELWVKVRKDWRRDDRFLREVGLGAPGDD